MLNIIYLKDFTPIEKGTSSDESVDIKSICQEVQDIINSSDELSIININGDNENKPEIFSNLNGEYCAQKYVGVIEHKQNKIVIGSRFDSDENQYFLQYVFSKAFDINGKIFDEMQILGKKEESWDVLLIIMYVKELKDAMKKGLYREYKAQKYNDYKAKGQIDIARHIKLNLIENGKIAYNSREYTVDNYYNYLFLKAYEIIDKKYPNLLKKLIMDDENVKSGITELKNKLQSLISCQDILKHTYKKIVHPVHKKYENLRRTSTIIIKKLGINALNTDNSKVTGFVIDMTKLWEKFLEKTLFKEISYSNVSQLTFPILNGKRVLQPDFYWSNYRLVIDAKYKYGWSLTLNDDWKNVRDDVFQVLAYMLSLKCNLGGVIFPTEIITQFPYEEKLSIFPYNNDTSRFFFRLPYFITKKDSFNDFSAEMDKQQKNIIEKLRNYIQ